MRDSAEFVKTNLTVPLTVAEIGVGAGSNALDMLEGLNIAQLCLVDPYVPYTDDGSPVIEETREEQQASLNASYDALVVSMEPHMANVVINKTASPVAAIDYADASFDYVYIDGCHFVDQVASDIAAWWSKVKVGGVLAGHDYESYPGVATAVDAFVAANGLTLTTSSHGGNVDWYVIK